MKLACRIVLRSSSKMRGSHPYPEADSFRQPGKRRVHPVGLSGVWRVGRNLRRRQTSRSQDVPRLPPDRPIERRGGKNLFGLLHPRDSLLDALAVRRVESFFSQQRWPTIGVVKMRRGSADHSKNLNVSDRAQRFEGDVPRNALFVFGKLLYLTKTFSDPRQASPHPS